jgi:hypothetical protein
MQPRGADGAHLLDAHGFRNAVTSRLVGETAAFFTLVLLRPERPAQIAKLASLVLGALRVEGGDLAGKLDGAVAVYLHAARRKDVAPFVERIREQWLALDGGEFPTDVAPYPVKKERVIDLLSRAPADTSAVAAHTVPRRAGGSLGDDARTA